MTDLSEVPTEELMEELRSRLRGFTVTAKTYNPGAVQRIGYNQRRVLELLGKTDEPLSVPQLVEQMGLPPHTGQIYGSVLALVHKGVVESAGGQHPQRWRLKK